MEFEAKRPIVLELDPGTHFWCKCGQSKNQPLCDGSHKGSGIQPVSFQVSEKKKSAYCVCKRTGKPPFCDGSHSK